jgi:hypothetical protein
MLRMKLLKSPLNLKASLFLVFPIVAFSSAVKADDYGCKALLCFAGGKNVSECQPTINQVLKDLKKGKSFPHCEMVSSNGTSQNATPKVTVRKSFIGTTIKIEVPKQFAVDQSHQVQTYRVK